MENQFISSINLLLMAASSLTTVRYLQAGRQGQEQRFSKSAPILKATFYDASGKILGAATGALNNVAAGDTKTFTLVGTDKVTGYKTMKVQLNTPL